MAIHLVQIKNTAGRCVALVKEPELLLLNFGSVYELTHRAIDSGMSIKNLINDSITGTKLNRYRYQVGNTLKRRGSVQ